MVNDFKKKDAQPSPEISLDEMLRDITDEQEKKLLTRAWHALGGLSGREHDPPGPSEELETIFGKSPKYSSVTKETGEETMTTNATKLYRMIMSDKAIQTELAGIGDKAEGLEAIVKLGKAHGLPVTQEEVRDFLAREPGEELTDAELEMVVGGKNLVGGSGSDIMWGGFGNDTMDGGVGNDTISGGTGNDYLSGGFGNDTMDGGDGEDTMYGGGGDDSMEGGAGNDTLTGGAGNDVFVFRMDDGHDTITDFNPQEDVLYLEGAEAHDIEVTTQNGNTVVTFGQTTITLEGVEMNKDQVWARVQN